MGARIGRTYAGSWKLVALLLANVVLALVLGLGSAEATENSCENPRHCYEGWGWKWSMVHTPWGSPNLTLWSRSTDTELEMVFGSWCMMHGHICCVPR